MSVLSTLPAGTYNIDPSHSRVGFSARHAMVTKVRGSFNEYSGSATVADGAASLNIDITVSSVDTRSADRDGHLQSADFFDAATFPKITFASTSVLPVSSFVVCFSEFSSTSAYQMSCCLAMDS